MIKRVLSYAIPADQGGRTVEEFLRGLGYSHRLVVHLKQTPGGILAGGESVFPLTGCTRARSSPSP